MRDKAIPDICKGATLQYILCICESIICTRMRLYIESRLQDVMNQGRSRR